MDKFPHDYLKSEYRDDIEIRIYRDEGHNVLELRYREGPIRYTSSRRLTDPKALVWELQIAEQKLVEEIKKT